MNTTEIPDASLWQAQHESQEGRLLPGTFGEKECLWPVQQEKKVTPE